MNRSIALLPGVVSQPHPVFWQIEYPVVFSYLDEEWREQSPGDLRTC